MGAGAETAIVSRRLVLLGPPGSGKGTQAALIAERAGVPAISTGEMLREAVATGSELGARVEDIMASGALVDDDTMAEVVRTRLAAADAADGFLLDGYPRTMRQVADLERILDRLGVSLDAVVAIEVPERELIERSLKRRRADDSEAVIRERQRVYRQKTEPLVEHYRGLCLLREVDGNQTIEKVLKSILEVLEEAS